MAMSSAPAGRADGLWRRIIRAVRALDDHWIGDLIGVASLFGMLWVALVAAAVLQ